jgi:glycosyltransferase involved in cell wall biosynthesis
MVKKNNKIKILEIITLFSIGGATETVVSMAKGLQKLGHEVEIATGPPIVSEGSMYETAESLGIPVYTFKNLRRDINLVIDIIIIFQLAWFIRKNKYDIVHTHSSKAGVVGRIAAYLAGAKVIIHTIHGLPFHRYQSPLQKKLFIFVEKISALFCDKIISVTHTIVDILVKDNIVPHKKLLVVRSAFNIGEYLKVNVSKEQTRTRFGLLKNDIVIGKIARLSKLKGHEYLLYAFVKVAKSVPNAKLLIVGNGELESELKQFVKKENLNDKVIFTGLVLPEDIPSIINTMDILVHSSLLEGLARVLPQAIMMEKPVISFDLDGAHEVIKDGINGYLIEPLNIEQLAERIIDLCINTAKAQNFGKVGKEFLNDEFDDRKMVAEIEKLYGESLIKS